MVRWVFLAAAIVLAGLSIAVLRSGNQRTSPSAPTNLINSNNHTSSIAQTTYR